MFCVHVYAFVCLCSCVHDCAFVCMLISGESWGHICTNRVVLFWGMEGPGAAEEEALDDEQTILDGHDDRIAGLVARAQQLVSKLGAIEPSTTSDSNTRRVLSKRLGRVEKNLQPGGRKRKPRHRAEKSRKRLCREQEYL